MPPGRESPGGVLTDERQDECKDGQGSSEPAKKGGAGRSEPAHSTLRGCYLVRVEVAAGVRRTPLQRARMRRYNKEAKWRAERGMNVEWVVRAGEAKPDKLQEGYTWHDAMPTVYGFSVQYSAGRSRDELAIAGQFPNAQVSYAYDDELATALLPLGYAMRLVPTPGRGFHHTFMVLYDASGAMLTRLPYDAAMAISQAFRRMPNPYRVRRRGRQP